MTFTCCNCKRQSHVSQEYHIVDGKEFCSNQCLNAYLFRNDRCVGRDTSIKPEKYACEDME